MPADDASATPSSEDTTPSRLRAWSQSVLAMGLLGSLLLWLAQPPAMLGWLAWVAPTPWLLLVLRERLTGWRAWLSVWLAGSIYWAAAVYWVALPHPLTPIGLFFLACYLGFYPAVFIALSRVGVHRAGLPLWLVAPVVWTGLEWIQAHLFSGFLMGALSHSQVWSPSVIQIAAWGGAYSISLVMMLFAAGLVDGVRQVLRSRDPNTVAMHQRLPVAFFAAAIPLAVTLFVGHFALQTADDVYQQQSAPTVALIQGDTRATWDPDPNRSTKIMDRQATLSYEAVKQAQAADRQIDLLVWPESMFRFPLVTFDDALTPPPDVPPEQAARTRASHDRLAALASWVQAPILVGIDRLDVQPPFDGDPAEWKFDAHNAVAITDSAGKVLAFYDKQHRVPYGEYIPLFENLPALHFLTPLPGAIKAGESPVAMPLNRSEGALIVSPNICYETVIPHVIRNQVKQLQDEGTPPDLLVNVTNNAWFWGSSELEMHLACNILRAVENRTPMVIAANGGLSAVIDSSGRVLEVSDRLTEQVILADVPLDPRISFYTRYGDLLVWPCLIVCGWLAIIGVAKADGGRRKAESVSSVA